MGRRRRGRRKSRPAASNSGSQVPELSLAPTDSIPHIASVLGNHGFILVLFETPSGFAIFCIDGSLLYLPDAKEKIWANFADHFRAQDTTWLRGYQFFEDKSGAINLDTGVDKQLTSLITRCRKQEKYMAVGKREYKAAIEKYLKIPCIYNEVVMEVMWGLKNLLHTLVPEEEMELTKEDRLQKSHGLSKLLGHYGFSCLKPEMVNELIVEKAAILVDCDSLETKHSAALKGHGDHLKDNFGINTQDWDLLKIATALKVIYGETIPNDAHEMFSVDEISKLRSIENYNGCAGNWHPKTACMRIYRDMVLAYSLRSRTVTELKLLVDAAITEARTGKSQVLRGPRRTNNL